jgi:hypothetical protein
MAEHEAAALLPFADDDAPAPAAGANHNQGVKP